MANEIRTSIPLKGDTYYRPNNFATQDEQNSHDDRQRRMVNYQVTDYVEKNDLICFGIASHETEEWLPGWTPKAQRDLDILSSWFPRSKANEMIMRPCQKSDWNMTNYASRAQVRCVLAIAAIRELPIKSFYARCWITYAYMLFFLSRGTGRGLRFERPIVMYNHQFESRALLNYPDMFWSNLTRILPKTPMPTPDAHREWRVRQTPVYHQYHKTCYRYRLRKPRYVPWDGSQSQPVMPFLHDLGSDVINGTFKRQCASTPQCR
jgi:hypothetical protein